MTTGFLTLLAAFVAATLSLVLSWGATHGRPRAWARAQPGDRHRQGEGGSIPRWGGLALALGFTAGAASLYCVSPLDLLEKWRVPMLIMGLLFALGFADDIRPLPARLKLTAQVLIGCLAYALGLRIELLTSFAGNSLLLPEPLGFLLTLGWLVLLPNVINLMDGADGVAGGLGVLVCLTLALVMMGADQGTAAALSVIFAAALAGFLVFNFPPAKIYLGDGGAYLVGGFIATVSMESSQKGSVAAIFLVVMLALGLPLTDTLYAILRRAAGGLPLFRADARHIHHRILALGYSKRATLAVLYGICLAFCGAGLAVFWTQGLALPIVAAILFLAILWIGKRLGVGTDWPALRRQVSQAAQWRAEIRRAHRMGDYLLSEAGHCRCPEDFWRLFEVSARRLGFLPARSGACRNPHDGEVASVVVQTAGNPPLYLCYPAGWADQKNWWALADCLYPAYAAAAARWEPVWQTENPINAGRNAQSEADEASLPA